MRLQTLKQALLSASVLVSVGHAGIASAHEEAGTLLKPAASTDLYRVTCFNDNTGSGDPAQVVVAVQSKGGNPSSQLSVQVATETHAGNSTAVSNTAFSPEVAVAGGFGPYTVTVDKSRKGRKSYTVRVHCMNAANTAETGISLDLIQDQ